MHAVEATMMTNVSKNVYICPELGNERSSACRRSRHFSGTVHRPTSILTGLRDLMGRPRSESTGNTEKKKFARTPVNKSLRRVQVESCTVESVYDLREEDEVGDVYTDTLAFRRPRSNSSDFLILRKTSRPLSVDVLGLVDDQADPYRQYMQVIDCYELAPHAGSVLLLDGAVKLEKAFRTLREWCVGSALVWSETERKVVSILTLTDFLLSILSDTSSCSSTVADTVSTNRLVTLDASCKLLDACEEFCSNRVHRIVITEPSGDVLYLLTIKRILQAVHKQHRSLHFALWLGHEIRKAHIGKWENIHSVGEKDTLETAVRMMIDYRISSVPIVDDDGHPIDVICKSDIAIFLDNEKNIKEQFLQSKALDVTSHRPRTSFLCECDSVAAVLETALTQKHCRCIFLTDRVHKRLCAAVSLSDFIAYILYHKQALNKNGSP